MIPHNPVNIQLMNVDDFIINDKILEVTSHSVHESSTSNFHPYGLFSESIFGEIGSNERLIKMGYINLHTKIFQPVVFSNLIALKKMYKDILSGSEYVKFDNEEQDFIRCDNDDMDGGTGFSFFVSHFSKIKFKKTDSDIRSNKIEIFNKYKDILLVDKLLITPAGTRDVRVDNGRLSTADINKIYLNILTLSKAIPSGMGDDPLFDVIRYNIQLKVMEIYDYLNDYISGKDGYAQDKYGARALALGTRNVISAANMVAKSPEESSYLKYDETLVPLFQAAKMYQPLVVHHLKGMFFDEIFTAGSTNVPVIDPKNNKLVYVEVSEKEKNKYYTPDGIETFINRFDNEYIRHTPVKIYDINNKPYYLSLIYDNGKEIYFFKDLQQFLEDYREHINKTIDLSNIRPITYSEVLYMATVLASAGKYMTVTRYPVEGIESLYPSKPHITTTINSRKVNVINITKDSEIVYEFSDYPILNDGFKDSLAIHPSRLKNLGGDHDKRSLCRGL